MEKEKRIEILVGIVTVIGLLILIFGVLWGKGASIFQDKQMMVVLFRDVRGLKTGDLVVVRGMEKGRVVNILLQDEIVEVDLELDTGIQLYTDLSAVVESKELMGGKQISICPGESGIPADLSMPVEGNTSGDPIVLFSQVSGLIEQIERVLDQLKPEELQTQLLALMKQLEATAFETRQVVHENRAAVKETVTSLKATTAQIEADSTLLKIGRLVVVLDSTTKKMNHLITLAEKGDGTVARLLQNPELYQNMKSTMASLDSLVRDVKENPNRYIHVSVF